MINFTRFFDFYRMRENLFACGQFLHHVPSLYLPIGNFLKSTTFGDFTSVLLLCVTLQFIMFYLVEIHIFDEPRPSAERLEARIVYWHHKMLQKLGVDSEKLSSLVVAVLLIFLSRGVLEGSWISIFFKLLCAVIIMLFSRIPLVRTGWQHRSRVLISCLSVFFLPFTLLVFLRLICFLILKMVEFPKSSGISFAIIILSLSLRVFYKIFGKSQLVTERSKSQEILEEDESQNDGDPDEMPSEVATTIVTDTLGSDQSNEEEGEKVEISPEVDSGQAKTAPDIEGYMSDCTLYCSLFPADYEFTKDTLVWSWIAAGIINHLEKDEMEKIAMRCFDKLNISKSILPSSYDRLSDQMRYKFGHVSFTNQKYRKKLDGDANFTDLEHLSLIFQEIDELQFKNLRNCSNLKTLLLHKCHVPKIENTLNHLFLGLKLVTLIDLSCTNIVELPSSIENLRNLMYLDLSQTPIRRLPESIDSLVKLETLILLGCQSLSGLPRAICKLINLQHLELDIAQLQSVPTGMGNLKNLQTLRTFVVGRKDGNGIGELMDMDKLKGSLSIFKLENIPNKEEASKAFLHKKIYLTKIEFIWSDLEDDKVTIEKEIVENLRPHFGLQELKIMFYSGGELPSWISDPSFNKMVNITLSGCRYSERLPCLGALPSLKILNVVDMDSVVCIDFSFCKEWGQRGFAFPQLEKLSFDGMSNLENWTGVEDGDFPCIVQLVIKYCPKLVSLPSPSHLKSPEVLKIINCPKLPPLPEGGIPSSDKCHIMVNTVQN